MDWRGSFAGVDSTEKWTMYCTWPWTVDHETDPWTEVDCGKCTEVDCSWLWNGVNHSLDRVHCTWTSVDLRTECTEVECELQWACQWNVECELQWTLLVGLNVSTKLCNPLICLQVVGYNLLLVLFTFSL